MKDTIAIKIEDVSKTFKLPHEKNMSIKSSVVNFWRHKKGYELQKAIVDVSFEVKMGEFFGIVGRNGSGKSTLLKLMAGIYTPDKGNIIVNGKLTPFIELGVGFNDELTGRENVYLNGSLLGFNRKDVDSMYADIVEFAELERFMDQKLKNYSSGMKVRLAFSIAIRVNSGILLLDEVLAVGDAAFQKKCYDYFRKLKKDKKTVVFISHDMNAVREYCDTAMLIDQGRIIFKGSTDKATTAYLKQFINNPNDSTFIEIGKRWGTGKAKIVKSNTHVDKKNIGITVFCEFSTEVPDPIFGLTIHNPIGVKVYESNTKWQKINTGTFKKREKVEVTWKIANVFTNGKNAISLTIANYDATEFFDNWEDATSFNIDKELVTTALVLPESSVEIAKQNKK